MYRNTKALPTISVEGILEKRRIKYTVANDLLCINDVNELPFAMNEVRMNCVFLGVCLEGQMYLTIDTVEYSIRPNDVFVIPSGHIISGFDATNNCRIEAVVGTPTVFHDVVKEMIDVSRIFMYVNRTPVRTFPSDQADKVKTALRTIKEHSLVQRPKYALPFAVSVIRALIYDLLDSFVAHDMNSLIINAKGEKVFFEFIQLVEANFRTQRRVSWYAKQIGISSKYLSELVKAISSETPNTWIDKYVIMELRLLLRDPSLNIKQITEMMDFPNQSFLGKYFKEHVGVSPSAYRKTL